MNVTCGLRLESAYAGQAPWDIRRPQGIRVLGQSEIKVFSAGAVEARLIASALQRPKAPQTEEPHRRGRGL